MANHPSFLTSSLYADPTHLEEQFWNRGLNQGDSQQLRSFSSKRDVTTDYSWPREIDLEFGLINGNRAEKNRRNLQDFLDHSQVKIATIGHGTARKYVEFFKYLRRKGRPIPVNDIWIAAIAEESGGELAARDGHFEESPMLFLADDI